MEGCCAAARCHLLEPFWMWRWTAPSAPSCGRPPCPALSAPSCRASSGLCSWQRMRGAGQRGRRGALRTPPRGWRQCWPTDSERERVLGCTRWAPFGCMAQPHDKYAQMHKCTCNVLTHCMDVSAHPYNSGCQMARTFYSHLPRSTSFFFARPSGVLVVSGLHFLPLWLWLHTHAPSSFLASLWIGALLFVGRAFCASVEIWTLMRHLNGLLLNDARNGIVEGLNAPTVKED